MFVPFPARLPGRSFFRRTKSVRFDFLVFLSLAVCFHCGSADGMPVESRLESLSGAFTDRLRPTQHETDYRVLDLVGSARRAGPASSVPRGWADHRQ